MGKVNSQFLRDLAVSNASSLNIASIESGALGTFGDYDKIIVIAIAGKLVPGHITGDDQPLPDFITGAQVQLLDPGTGERTTGTLNDTPFSSADMHISVDDEHAKFPDRAVSVLYDAKTNMTFIGISQGKEFDRRDVKKTLEDRQQHPGEKEYDRRIAENMKLRLQQQLRPDGNGYEIDSEGYYERIEDGKVVRRLFDVQNPHQYWDPAFDRTRQIAEMENELLAAVKATRRVAAWLNSFVGS